jgi:hypothetical protein
LKLVEITCLVDVAGFTRTPAWERVSSNLREAIEAIHWPPDSSIFTIYPQSGKKRGQGNGVKPIKEAFVLKLLDLGWKPEQRYPRGEDEKEKKFWPGAFDAWLDLSGEGLPPFVAEWETGNISSSHRAMNKMAMGLMAKKLSGGMLVLPTRALYNFLTDRVGNYRELEPYFTFWPSLPIEYGCLGVIAVEHDAVSTEVPRIKKGTDGWALIRKERARPQRGASRGGKTSPSRRRRGS